MLLRSGALWLDALLGELTMFPESEHDDQVDALVYGVLELLLDGELTMFPESEHDDQVDALVYGVLELS